MFIIFLDNKIFMHYFIKSSIFLRRIKIIISSFIMSKI